eukprot:6155499-Ditylum_brightwellii.AAC.1
MLRSHDLDNQNLDAIDPLGKYLANTAWAIRCACHTTLEAMPGQLVYSRDMILEILYVADWNKITNKNRT